MNPILLTDGYKLSHQKMLPKNCTLIYSNLTPRSVNYMPEGAKEVVVFGVQYTVQYIQEAFQNNFFNQPKSEVIGEAKEYISDYLGGDYDTSHFEALHDLGYLPIHVKALDEGTIVGVKVPILTIYNTLPEFFWLPNFLETLISSLIWKPMHSASLALGFKKILMRDALATDKENLSFVDFQGHDFSFRGMQHPESAISSGLGFLTSFRGTDTVPALRAAYKYYDEKGVANSVAASEHAVMTAYGKENEIDAFRRLMSQFPTGILSIVSDSFDLWQVLTKFMPELKDEIMSRDGKIVIRPDSGDPVDILCGRRGDETFESIQEGFAFVREKYKEYLEAKGYFDYASGGDIIRVTANSIDFSPEHKGVIELLWEVFGGTVNEQGFKVLDPHIGAIYGDSINLDRAQEINRRLAEKGFASTNWVAGIGSFSMGYATRDNQGSAVKATYCEVQELVDYEYNNSSNGSLLYKTVGREIFKDPITDDGLKKSAKGLLKVFRNEDGVVSLQDQVSWEEEGTGLLTSVFLDGQFTKRVKFSEIRERLNS